MTRLNPFALALVAATALAACSVSEAGNIPCGDTTNCPAAYPTCSSKGFCVASAPVSSLELVDGDAQNAISGSALTKSLTVRALDTNGNAVAGVAVSWSAGGTASVSAASTTTGPDGKTSVVGTLGKKNGTYSFTAASGSLAGSPVKFTASGVSGPAAKLVLVAGSNQTAVAGSSLATPLAAMVTDINDNPVVGATVSWAATGGGGSVALGSTTTVSDGTASTVAVLGTVVGPNAYSASASFGGAPLAGSPIVFNATGAAGAAAKFVLSGPTSTVAGVAQSFTLTVQDSNSNVAVGYTGTAIFGSNDGIATLPAPHLFTAADAGVLHFSATLKTAGTSALTAVDGLLNTSITGIAVTPAATASLLVAGFISPTSADASHSFTVTAKDAFGNTTPAYRGTVHFSSVNSIATVPADYPFTAGDAGVHNGFSAQLSKASAGNDLTATDTITASITGSQTGIVVNPGAAASLTLAGFPNPIGAGVPGFVLVTAKDAFGNTAVGYSGTVHFSSTNPNSTLPADFAFTATEAGAKSFPVTLNTASSGGTPTYSITVTDTVTSSISGSIAGLVVDPAPVSTLVVTATPATRSAGIALTSVTVTAKDTFGNTVPTYSGTVHFTSTDPQAVLPPDTTLTSGTKSFTTVVLKTAGSQTITATDTVTSSITGTSPTVTVNPAATSVLVVSPQGSTETAGVAFNVIVTAKDAFNNTTPAYAGTVHFTSSDGQAVLPPNTTLTSGTATLLMTLKTSGSQTITATDTVTSSITGTSTGVTVNPAATSKFVFASPGTATAGVPFTVTVTAKDAFNNVTPAYSGTVHFTSSDGQSSAGSGLPADSTLTSGVATFTGGVTLRTSGSQTVTATDTVTAAITGTTAAVTVSPAAAASLQVTTAAGSPQTAGVAFNVTVVAKDAFSNTATAYAGTVQFTSSDSQAVLPANSTLLSGARTFTTTQLRTAGAQTITARDTVSASVTGTSPSITVTAAGTASLTVTATSPQNAGVAFNVSVTAKDAFNNIATGYAGTVHLTSSDGAAVLGANNTLVSGVGTFSATLKTAGAQSVTATDTVTASITGSTGSITVNPGAASTLLVTAGATQVAGTAFNVTVTARDSFGNTATGYAGTIHLTSTDSQAILGSDSTLTAGTKAFNVTLKTAGTQTVTATDTVNAALTNATGVITVNPGATTTYLVSAGTAQTAGTQFSVSVTAKDASGNTTPAYGGTVQITSSDLAATLPASSTLTAGAGSFNVTLRTAGTQSVTATDSVNGSITATFGGIAVAPGPTFKLVFSGFPSSVVAGFANSITLTAQDANSNITPSYAGTVTFSSNNAGAVLPGAFTFVPGTDFGTHNFTNGITLNTPVVAAGTITATDGTSVANAVQSAITVVAQPVVFQTASALIVGGSRAGQIFITGGSTTSDDLGTANSNTYFYNPATNSMSPGPAMVIARYAHTATATTSGQVIVAGGNYTGNGGTDPGFEVCSTDGASPSCVAVGGAAVGAARCNGAAALVTSSPSFRVVIAGGDNCAGAGIRRSWDGWDSASPTTSITVLNALATGGRHLFTATPLGNGQVLFAGGGTSATADLFTNNSTFANSTTAATTGGMSVVRLGHTATLIGSGLGSGTSCASAGPCVLIAGGNSTAAKTWEIYDGSTNTFPRGASTGHDLVVPGRQAHVAAKFSNGKVQLAGGNDSANLNVALKSSESFDPSAQISVATWSAGADMGLTRNKASGVYAASPNKLFVVGGNATTPSLEATTAP